MKTGSSSPVRWIRTSALAGGSVWILLLLPLSAWFDLPVESGGETWLIERLLLLSALVFTPLTLSIVATPNDDGSHSLPFRAAVVIQPFAALLVVASLQF